MRLCIGLVMLVFLVSCEEDRFEYVLPVNKPRMVVNFVSMDRQPWIGTLTASLPVLELPDFTGVPGATINVFEDGILIETRNDILYDPRHGSGEATMLSSPTPGKMYTIEAIADGYATASATYQQPLPVPVEYFDIKLVGPDPKFQNEDAIQFSITFIDPPGENFYLAELIPARDSTDLIAPWGFGYYLFFEDPAYENLEYYSYVPRYFDDEYFDGQRVTMTFRARAMESQFNNGSRPEDRFDYHWAALRNISKTYYRYLQTMEQQYNNFGDPYAQPVKVATNVENGFGVVGGWTRTLKGKPFVY